MAVKPPRRRERAVVKKPTEKARADFLDEVVRQSGGDFAGKVRRALDRRRRLGAPKPKAKR